MEVIDPEKKYTPETYLKFEKDGDIRHEFVAGYIYSMSGSSRVHNTITNNLMIETGPKLRGQRCRPYANDVKVHIKLEPIPETGIFRIVNCKILISPKKRWSCNKISEIESKCHLKAVLFQDFMQTILTPLYGVAKSISNACR